VRNSTRAFIVLLSAAWALAAFAGTARAQLASDGEAAAVEETDAKDVVGRLFNRSSPAGQRDYRKAEWLRVPVLASSPGMGTLLGGGAEVTFFRGDPLTTRASTIVGSAAASFEGRLVAGVRLSVQGEDNRWLLLGDNRFERASQNSYGLGTSSRPANEFTASYSFPRVNDVVYRRVSGNLYAGLGFHFSNHSGVEPVDGTAGAFERSEYVAYSVAHGFDLRSQGAAGTSLNLRFDSRDSSVRATRGVLASASYQTFVKGFLGGDSAWQKLNLDLRSYRALDPGGRHVLAAWGYADLVTGGVAPYFDLPANGTDMQGRSGRGYAVARFRGERLAYGELEYRGTLTRNGLLGIVAFVNATTVSDQRTGERLFQSVAPGAGAGLRLLADKLSRTRVCLDFAVGRQGSTGVYLVLQEAF
jgi:hypothetical protein